MMSNCTKNFKFDEFVVSKDYPYLAEEIKLTEVHKQKIYTICNVLEEVRSLCSDHSIRILSGVRNEELNKAINGSVTSDHLYYKYAGAIDFDFFGNKELLWVAYKNIAKIAPFGQAIIYIDKLEDGKFNPRFIHYSLPTQKRCREELVKLDSYFMFKERALAMNYKLRGLID